LLIEPLPARRHGSTVDGAQTEPRPVGVVAVRHRLFAAPAQDSTTEVVGLVRVRQREPGGETRRPVTRRCPVNLLPPGYGSHTLAGDRRRWQARPWGRRTRLEGRLEHRSDSSWNPQGRRTHAPRGRHKGQARGSPQSHMCCLLFRRRDRHGTSSRYRAQSAQLWPTVILTGGARQGRPYWRPARFLATRARKTGVESGGLLTKRGTQTRGDQPTPTANQRRTGQLRLEVFNWRGRQGHRRVLEGCNTGNWGSYEPSQHTSNEGVCNAMKTSLDLLIPAPVSTPTTIFFSSTLPVSQGRSLDSRAARRREKHVAMIAVELWKESQHG